MKDVGPKHPLDVVAADLTRTLEVLRSVEHEPDAPSEKTPAYAIGWATATLESVLEALAELPRCTHRRRTR